MGDKPRPDGSTSPDDDETAKLELPSLTLPGFGRKRRRKDEATPEPEAEPEAELEPEVGAEPERVVHEQPTTALPAPAPEPLPEPELRPEPVHASEPEPAQPRRRARSRPSLPRLPGWVAALVTGIVVGLFGVALTALSLRGCEAVRGTQSCGGPGAFLLVVILVLMVLLGGVVLAALGVSESGSTSFLAVGVLCVVVLLVLADRLFTAWMFVVVPLVDCGRRTSWPTG